MATKSSSSVKRVRTVTSSGNGRPSKDGAKKIYDKVAKAEDRYNQDYLSLEEGQASQLQDGYRDNRFPVRLYPRDKYDDVAHLKQGLIEGTGGSNTPFGQATLTTDDMAWLRRKVEAEQQADFKQWVMQQFDMRDTAQRAQFQQMFSEYLSEQESIIDDRAELSARLAKMALRGPKNKEDYMFLYLLNTNAIELPDGKLWDPTSWKSEQRSVRTMSRGLFNPNQHLFSKKPQPSFSFSALSSNASPQDGTEMPGALQSLRKGGLGVSSTFPMTQSRVDSYNKNERI